MKSPNTYPDISRNWEEDSFKPKAKLHPSTCSWGHQRRISLMQEGISYMAGSELPAVIVNMSRSGPGLGGIAPSQGDYFQATRGGGHGDYRVIVLAPASVQEMYDLTLKAFDLADTYRNPVLILGDSLIGQMKEPMLRRKSKRRRDIPKPWALTGAEGRKPNILKSLYLNEGELTQHNWKLHEKYQRVREKEVLFETRGIDGAQIVVVAFGSIARIVKSAMDMAANAGLKVGLFRPITLFPFPQEALNTISRSIKTGQMVEDVQLSVQRDAQVHFYGRPPGSIPTPEEILEEITKGCPP
jgi:2-oxoglutarate ferredoxin oxidoreductase subunit alpha